MMAFAFPHALDPVSWLWTNPTSYNFASSEWGGLVFKLFYLVLVFVILRMVIRPWLARIHAHLECEVPGCERWGHPVHGTSHRACKEHHPHLDPDGHSAEHIATVAEYGHSPTADSAGPSSV